MLRAYICSSYRARTEAEFDRNIDYAQELTRRALMAGVAPITPHLYLTQCLNDKKREERAVGMAAGMQLLKGCDFVIAGIKYGISEGMRWEIALANERGIDVVNADELAHYLRHRKRTYAISWSAEERVRECQRELQRFSQNTRENKKKAPTVREYRRGKAIQLSYL